MIEPDPLRRLELALTGVLGRSVEVRWGTTLASDGTTIWLPRQSGPLIRWFVLGLQAALVGEGGPAPAGSGWHPILRNLYVAHVVRQRFPGLVHEYHRLRGGARLRRPEVGGRTAETGVAEAMSELIGTGLVTIPFGERERARALRAWDRWQAEWNQWLAHPVSPPPLPDRNPPDQRLPFQADWSEPTPEGEPGTDIQAGEAPLVGPPPASGYSIPFRPQGTILIVPSGAAPVPLTNAAAEAPERSVWLEESTTSRSDAMPAPIWYDEWDADHHRYRRQWCAVYERPLNDVGPRDRSEPVLNAGVRKVRRAFERFNSDNRWRGRELEGAEVDMDAVVEAWAEGGGRWLTTDRLYRRWQRHREPCAVAVLIDVSESTGGWTLELERRALLLLGTALDSIGDTSAFFSFSGRSRQRCDVFRIKDYDEPYGAAVADRVASLRPLEYTRIAPSLRHVARTMAATELRHRILLLITDGMPYDVEGYGGAYAVEDTRRAWIECRAAGIHPYCLTIDIKANQYLPRMCGPAAWTVVPDAERLPDALLRLYGRVAVPR